jgi:hypothetical protein
MSSSQYLTKRHLVFWIVSVLLAVGLVEVIVSVIGYFYFVILALLSKMAELCYCNPLLYMSNHDYVVKILEPLSVVHCKGSRKRLARI